MPALPWTDERTVPDAAFLDALRLPAPWGTRLAAARAADDLPAVHQVVADHFRQRPGPVWTMYLHGSAWLEKDGRGSVLERADGLQQQRLKRCWLPYTTVDMTGPDGSWDWQRAEGTVDASADRAMFVVECTTAFALTGDAGHLATCKDLLFRYWETWPFVLEDGFAEDHDRHFGGPRQGTLSVGLRNLRLIDLIYSGALHLRDVFSDAEVFRLFKHLWFTTAQLGRLVGDGMRDDNHHLHDHGYVTFVLAVLFPEFAGAREMLAYSRRVFLHHVDRNLLADGGYAEHSINYNYHIAYLYLFSHTIARLNRVELFTPREVGRLRRWIGFLLDATLPSGSQVPFGDHPGQEPSYLLNTLAGGVATPALRNAAADHGLTIDPPMRLTGRSIARRMREWQPGQPLGWSLYSWYSKRPQATGGRHGEPPARRYPNTGFSFLRSDTSRAADYLALSHTTDSIPHGHCHWDPLSFVLETRGRTLIGDPASAIYMSNPDDGDFQRRRGYHYSMGAHNCLVMDDDTLKPLEACGHRCFWGGRPPRHGLGICKPDGAIEVLEAWHDAYAPTRHHRYVIHLRGLGFVLVDRLGHDQVDLKPHDYVQLLHLEAGVQHHTTRAGAMHLGTGRATCTVIPGGACAAGWTAAPDPWLEDLPGFFEDQPAPTVLRLRRCVQGPAVFLTALLTRAGGRSRHATYLGERPQRSTFQQHDGFAASRIDLGDHGRLYLASCPYGKPVTHESFATDAALAVVHLDPDGRPRAWCLHRGSRLVVEGRQLVRTRTTWGSG